MRTKMLTLLIASGCLAISLAQVTFAPSPSGVLSGTCTVPAETVNVLPAGFDRDVNAEFPTTHLLNSTEPLEQAAALAGCQVLVFDQAFQAILGPEPSLTVLASTSAPKCCTDGLVYLPETNEMTFTSFPSQDPPTTRSLNRVDLATGAVTPVPLESPIGSVEGMNNGLGPLRGQVLAATIGNLFDTESPAGVAAYNPYNGTWEWLTNSFFGLRYNGINDLISLKDGTVIFSDSSFPQFQMQSKAIGQLPDRVYALQPGGVPRVLVDNLIDMSIGYPNGVEVSPDESTLFLSVTPNEPMNAAQAAAATLIYAFDLVRPATGGIFAFNKRTFAAVDVGYPDGMRVDVAGNLYVGAGDGVQVFSAGGALIGKIIVAPNTPDDQSVYGVGWAGNTLVITHNTELLHITLNTTGVISAASF